MGCGIALFNSVEFENCINIPYFIQWDLGFGYLIHCEMGLYRLFNSVGFGIPFCGYMAYVIGIWVYLFHRIWD
jgi:hypothetical protein